MGTKHYLFYYSSIGNVFTDTHPLLHYSRLLHLTNTFFRCPKKKLSDIELSKIVLKIEPGTTEIYTETSRRS